MGHTCRGTINLATANIAVEDSCNFVISNGGAQTYHLKASSEVERQRWITALELAKAKAVHMQAESGEIEGKTLQHHSYIRLLMKDYGHTYFFFFPDRRLWRRRSHIVAYLRTKRKQSKHGGPVDSSHVGL